MEKTISTIQVKIADKYPIDEKFDFDENIVIILKGEIVKKDIKNNQDNSVDLILHFKALDYKINRASIYEKSELNKK